MKNNNNLCSYHNTKKIKEICYQYAMVEKPAYYIYNDNNFPLKTDEGKFWDYMYEQLINKTPHTELKFFEEL